MRRANTDSDNNNMVSVGKKPQYELKQSKQAIAGYQSTKTKA
jgi:hypothetical protein